MDLLAKIIGEVSDHESNISRLVDVPQQFVAVATETILTDRSTYTHPHLSDNALHQTDQVIHVKGIIDNGELGGICAALYILLPFFFVGFLPCYD